MKILYVTTVGITMRFFTAFAEKLINDGHTLEIATNEADFKVPDCYREWGCKIHHINTCRSPIDKGNINAISQIKKLVDENKYDIVHCHTPIAAMCTRLACIRSRKKGTKVFYTAHGFHFFKGAPKKNWIIFYPIEKLCAYFTDVLVTINHEDYALARKKFKAKKVVYVPGVGIDIAKFGNSDIDILKKRCEIGIPDDSVLFLSVGELNDNKNHETVIRAIRDVDKVYYIIAGEGERRAYLESLIDELGMTDRVKLLGYRRDINELCCASDAFIFPSFREGLSVSVMEAMASGMPCVVSKIRGNCDLIKDGEGGFLCNPSDSGQFADAIKKLIENPDMMKKMGEFNSEYIKKFSLEEVQKEMEKIYTEVLL